MHGQLFSKIRLKLAREFLILRNPTKKKNCGFRAAAAINSAENLDIFTSLSENDGLVYQNDLLHVCSVSKLQHRDVKILPRTAFSLRVIFGLYSFCNLKIP